MPSGTIIARGQAICECDIMQIPPRFKATMRTL